MKKFPAALGAAFFMFAAGHAHADCPAVTFTVNHAILPGDCGPAVFTGSSSVTVSLPASAAQGQKVHIVNAGSAALDLGAAAPVNGAASTFPIPPGTGGEATYDAATGWWYDGVNSLGGGTGSVTSVALTAPSWLTVTGSPVTSAGTLALTGVSEAANLFLASPNGSAGVMTPRAIVTADIPTGTSGATIPLLNSNLTLSGTDNFTGTFEIGGSSLGLGGNTTLPAAPASTQCLQMSSAGAITPTGSACDTAAGTVTSVGLTMPGSIFAVGGSPVTSSGTLAVSAAGTSGGIPYFSSVSALGSSAALTANLPVIGGGAGAAPTVGSRSGNTTTFATTSGTLTSGDCARFDASGNLVDNGSGCSGGGTAVVFVGATAGSANSYTIASPTPSGFTLTNQYVVRATISATNTGTATLNVNATGATAIERNTVSGLTALAGGELVAGLEYDFTYNSTCTCFVVATTAARAVTAGTTQTITAAQWLAGNAFPVTAGGQTITLPASAGLNPSGGIVIPAVSQGVTVALASGTDAVLGYAVGASVFLPPGFANTITTDAAGHFYVSPGNFAPAMAASLTKAMGAL